MAGRSRYRAATSATTLIRQVTRRVSPAWSDPLRLLGTSIPEPASFLLLGSGLAGLLWRRRGRAGWPSPR
ncbi:MAG: PEP-CTERM sorting domain-containing protein [Stellaceae bacterium]